MAGSYDSKWIDRLAEQARILGEFPMVRDGQNVTPELRQIILARFKESLERWGKTMAWAARSMNLSASTLSQVISGTYAADDEQHVRTIDRWLGLQMSRERAPKPPGFVKTAVAERIYGVAKWIIDTGGIGVVHGPSGCGKSITLQAIAAESPGSIFVSISTAGQSKRSVLELIGSACCGGGLQLTAWQQHNQIVRAMKDTGRLIIVDEIHKLAGRQNDEAMHALRDLHDQTKCPMLWAGMTKIASYIQQGNADGYDPLEQIYGRVSMWLNLTEIAMGTDGGPGLFTVDDVRRVFAAGKIRLTDDGARFLQMLANVPKLGGLRTCATLVRIAQRAAGDRPITGDMLRDIQRQRLGERAAESVEQQMEAMAGAVAAAG